ncbi:hypothetical protein PM082_024585 [Marasmius tenuissimus]|nr:hypothetical protein PM082_024585 [Marasmius tenuissimus]
MSLPSFYLFIPSTVTVGVEATATWTHGLNQPTHFHKWLGFAPIDRESHGVTILANGSVFANTSGTRPVKVDAPGMYHLISGGDNIHPTRLAFSATVISGENTFSTVTPIGEQTASPSRSTSTKPSSTTAATNPGSTTAPVSEPNTTQNAKNEVGIVLSSVLGTLLLVVIVIFTVMIRRYRRITRITREISKVPLSTDTDKTQNTAQHSWWTSPSYSFTNSYHLKSGSISTGTYTDPSTSQSSWTSAGTSSLGSSSTSKSISPSESVSQSSRGRRIMWKFPLIKAESTSDIDLPAVPESVHSSWSLSDVEPADASVISIVGLVGGCSYRDDVFIERRVGRVTGSTEKFGFGISPWDLGHAEKFRRWHVPKSALVWKHETKGNLTRFWHKTLILHKENDPQVSDRTVVNEQKFRFNTGKENFQVKKPGSYIVFSGNGRSWKCTEFVAVIGSPAPTVSSAGPSSPSAYSASNPTQHIKQIGVIRSSVLGVILLVVFVILAVMFRRYRITRVPPRTSTASPFLDHDKAMQSSTRCPWWTSPLYSFTFSRSLNSGSTSSMKSSSLLASQLS